MWIKHVPPGKNLKTELERVFSSPTGILVRRGSSEVVTCYKVRIVLQYEHWQGKPYFILTAFPKA